MINQSNICLEANRYWCIVKVKVLVLLLALGWCGSVLPSPTGYVLESSQWHQLVIPGKSDRVTIRDLFADDLPATQYNLTWVIYLFDAADGVYRNPGLDGTLAQSAGFWIVQTTGLPVVLDLPVNIESATTQPSSACTTSRCSIVNLTALAEQSSYQMVGSALATNVSSDMLRLQTEPVDSICANGCDLSEAVQHQYMSAPLWRWDAEQAAYVDLYQAGSINTWQSFWLQTRPAAYTAQPRLLFPEVDPHAPLAERAQASRFLAQATFGPTTELIDTVVHSGIEDWINAQIELPVTSMREAFDALQAVNPSSAPSRDWIFETFWRHAVEAEDQLRQRIAFALSQIFVISLREGAVASFPRGAADFYSVLERGAFGNFRNLLQEITLHPMMGAYLSHLGNEKGNAETGRVPDENFAREIMQLFSIGLHELNEDGTVKKNAQGELIETYSNEDVKGLARVFTGFSWAGPDTSIGRFQGWISVPDRDILPMQPYPQFHSTLEKRFLGTVINGQSTSNAMQDLEIALDSLFYHPNVGPFIGKQLIQRLVTSNPSTAYVARVAAVFSNNGEGERGDLSAVVKAILLDDEARNGELISVPTQGRVREPILRLAHWMRSFNARPADNRYLLLGTDDPATSIGMTVLRSPSVFNFYRPGYVPSNTPIADAGLVSPEMQITHETSMAGYLNFMLNAVELGTGSGNSISSRYETEVKLSHNPNKLVEHLNVLLMHGSMSESLQQWLLQAIGTVDLPASGDQSEARLQRVRIAVYLALSSPEYIVLK